MAENLAGPLRQGQVWVQPELASSCEMSCNQEVGRPYSIAHRCSATSLQPAARTAIPATICEEPCPPMKEEHLAVITRETPHCSVMGNGAMPILPIRVRAYREVFE